MKRAGHKRESEVSIPARELKDVPDQIYSTIVEAILDRALDPGTKLPEEVFCSHYGVSRTVVRIAIHRLEQDDLVEVQKNKGCFIVVPNRQAAADIMAARKALEIYVVKGMVGAISNEELLILKAHVAKEDKAYETGDSREALRLSVQFHQVLGGLAKNKVIETFLHNLLVRSTLAIATYSDVTACCKTHDHHRLVELLETGTIQMAADHIERHLNDIERDLLKESMPDEKPTLESVLGRYAKLLS